ncbi:efflux transporter outer membrane subunit [Erythrobacter sp. YT30]|uniref:efflux transporter outer membrane subunit n=1 Tax=Erythrobacter sp. YT30 TaxID=1735012 RepID=UPI00076DDEC8|nr:efflux transporter outer membrane subunit [Erythrobacter sp. YT30]KWV91155.1 multidrug transporter [Erythrobacter sp. YT30]
MRALPLLLLTVSLSACVAGPAPEIATPAPELGPEFLYQPEVRTSASLASLMPNNDPAYAALSQIALAEAPTLAEAAARIEAARAGAKGAGAARLPNVTADGSVTGTRINPNQFGSDNPFASQIDTEQVQYGANIVASWDADLFGRLKARERAALARVTAAEASAQAVRLALLSEIAGSVVDWRTLSERAAALEDDVKAAEALAALAKTREDAGLAPGFDRVRAEAAASGSRVRLSVLDSERVRIVGRLVTLTGQSAAVITQALNTNGPALDPMPAPASLPSELLANRPDVVSAASELAATDADLAAAARSRFPQLTLSAVVGLLAFSAGDFFSEDSIVGTLAAGLAGPILDFGRIEAEIDGAAANKKLAFASYRGTVFQALGDAEAAYGLVAASDREAELSVKERDELQRAAALADTRYRAGLANFLDVLEARRAADASGERAAAALGRAMRARILLWQALGGDARPEETA